MVAGLGERGLSGARSWVRQARLVGGTTVGSGEHGWSGARSWGRASVAGRSGELVSRMHWSVGRAGQSGELGWLAWLLSLLGFFLPYPFLFLPLFYFYLYFYFPNLVPNVNIHILHT